ncbi:permease [Amycolatopsis antarctica]|uniref:Permease n=1 Tax=Amycolatopsis antarctica TaxID=1854586 RepID=A0A263D5J5_9PSEU|nr:ABC transporter permease [Amycolatopsis antarctica]OZM72746.1 permease [Amycolatopsis antarctica]
MRGFGLAMKVLRVDRRARTSAILTGVGVAMATALVLLLASLPFAAQARAERSIWQQDYGPSEAQATLSVAYSSDYSGDEEITRLDVAPIQDASTVELPAGLPKLPGPGEVLVSPALAERMQSLPGSQLADRFNGEVAGTIGPEALEFPEQLAAVVGHTPDTISATATNVDGFTTGPVYADGFLELLAGVGLVVLVVPSLVLAASAARLTAARRERRLAAMRLAGATPRQVVSAVSAETGIAAVGGTLLGLAISPGLRWLATFVPWEGGTWLLSDFTPPLPLTIFALIATPILVLMAAVIGLRKVVYTPLGATARTAPKPLHWWRLLALPVAIGGFFLAVGNSSGDSGPIVALIGLAAMIASAALVGPWLTSAVGRVFVRVWRRPAGLLAGRRLTDDPKGAYRASAGVVLAVFAGSMALTLLPTFEAQAGGGPLFKDEVLYVESITEGADAAAERANAELARYGQVERVRAVPTVYVRDGDRNTQALVADCNTAAELTRFDTTSMCASGPGVYSGRQLDAGALSATTDSTAPGVPFAPGTLAKTLPAEDQDLANRLIVDPAVLPAGVVPQSAMLAVPASGESRDVVRTALAGAVDGAQVESREILLAGQQTTLADLRRVTVIGLGAAALLAGCSAAIATAGSVMDRRRTFGTLLAAGTPVRTLARALRTEAALPAIVATVGAGGVGILAAIGLLQTAEEGGPVLTPWVLAPIVLGAGVAVFAAAVCRPALKRVQTEPLADE